MHANQLLHKMTKECPGDIIISEAEKCYMEVSQHGDSVTIMGDRSMWKELERRLFEKGESDE